MVGIDGVALSRDNVGLGRLMGEEDQLPRFSSLAEWHRVQVSEAAPRSLVEGGGEAASSAPDVQFLADFPAAIALATLDGVNGFRLDGIDAFDFSGFSVSSAGDVNGDGFDDIVIGALYARSGRDRYAGESYVVFGKAGGFAASLDLGALDGSNGFRLNGVDANDQSGVSVSAAGDVNGDGFDDIIIGAAYADPNGDDAAGAAYVVFGNAGGFGASFDLALLDGANGFRLAGVDPSDFAGFSVASAGDVNGGGFDDIVIGAASADPGGDSVAGESYVVFGRAGGFTASLNLAALDGSNGFRIDGIDAYDASGISVSSAGDVNGDGFDDIIIGADSAAPNGDYTAGESYVVFGSSAGFAPSLDLAALDGRNGFRLDGVNPGDRSGGSVSSAGDVNGDGFGDIIIGAAYAGPDGAGASYVVFGQASGFAASIDLSTLDGSDGFRIDGRAAFDLSGFSVSSAGDVDGDGFDDLIIGAFAAYPGGVPYAGESYVVFGRAPTEVVTRTGSAASQTIRGGDFADSLSGLGGADTLGGGKGADTLDGGSGKDWADYSTANKVRADLKAPATNTREAMGDVYISIENLRGSNAADNLLGDDFDNRIEGLGDRDRLSGRDGDDALAGGAGKDKLTGGAGADDFELASLSAADADNIIDFAPGEDRIALDGSVFDLGEGKFKNSRFVIGTAAGDGNDRLIYDDATGKLFFDADGTGAQAQVLIATLTGAPAIAASDFIVI